MSQPTLILGTAGHIDHGKTALVRALTGTDTDRLPQEQARGMTIDIGFAELRWGDRQIGIIDVPGHERFIKNMLAGAATIDLALLVVAADDSVMPQTREHLAILELLGVRKGVIAITKCDLREDDWLELVTEEITELVASTGLADAEIIRTAVPAGEPARGLEDLKHAIGRVADSIEAQDTGDRFRLCVDRSFTVAGRGTVVTGTVCSGRAAVGDDLEWLPAEKTVHLRGLHNHGQSVDSVERGQRAAVNLAGVHHDEIGRGDVLASPGYLKATTCLTVALIPLQDSPWPLKHRGRYTLHIGTQAVPTELYLFDSNALHARRGKPERGEPAEGDPGDSNWKQRGWGQLHCQAPVMAVWGQPFVLRLESPVATLGGGHVLQPATRPVRRRHVDLSRLQELDSVDPLARAAAAIYYFADGRWSPDDLRASCGLSGAQLGTLIKELQSQGVCEIASFGQGLTQLVHTDRLAEWEGWVLRAIDAFHISHPLSVAMSRPQLVAQLEKRLDRNLIEAVIDRLLTSQRLSGGSASVALAEFTPQLDAGAQRLLSALRSCFADSGFQPPTLKELLATLNVPEKTLRPVLQLAVDTGELVPVSGELYLSAEAERTMRERLREKLSTVDGLTVSQIRDILDTSRKFAVPICEYLDRIGLTRRRGDLRILASPSI